MYGGVRHARRSAHEHACGGRESRSGFGVLHKTTSHVAAGSLGIPQRRDPRRVWAASPGRCVRLGRRPSLLAAQLKWAIATRCLRGESGAQSLIKARTTMRHIMQFLREEASEVTSLLHRDLETWQLRLRSHLLARGT